MAIGFQVSGTNITTATIIPDRSLKRASKPNVRTADFGDGYEQRSRSGLNSIKETYTVNLSNRPKETADDIVKFFDDKAGVNSFDFTIPDTDNTTATGEKTIKVVCDTWDIQYANGNHYTVNATFRRVYMP